MKAFALSLAVLIAVTAVLAQEGSAPAGPPAASSNPSKSGPSVSLGRDGSSSNLGVRGNSQNEENALGFDVSRLGEYVNSNAGKQQNRPNGENTWGYTPSGEYANSNVGIDRNHGHHGEGHRHDHRERLREHLIHKLESLDAHGQSNHHGSSSGISLPELSNII